MKNLKFSSDLVDRVIDGSYYKTWRLFDDKQLNVGDMLILINSDNNEKFGYAEIQKITIKRIKELSEDDFSGHKPYSSSEDIMADFKKYYGPNVDENVIVKVVDFKFNKNYEEKTDENITMPLNEVKIFTDGGSRGNPGPSACAYVITDMADNVVNSAGVYLGLTTNNQAEYQAVRNALVEAGKNKFKIIHFYLDSLLVVNQMNGIFKIRNRDLWPIHQEIKQLIERFARVTFAHIPREMNSLADKKVNEILDSTDKRGLKSDLL